MPLFGAASVASIVYGDLMLVPKMLAALIFPPSTSFMAAIALTALCLAIAASSARYVAHGLNGWIRHLPVSGLSQRRAATGGLAIAQVPLLGLVFIAGLMTIIISPSATSSATARLMALPIIAWATALASLHTQREIARPIALAAAIIAGIGSWWLIVPATILLIAADRLAGPIQVCSDAKNVSKRRSRAGSSRPYFLWLRIAWRALGWHLPYAAFVPLILIGPALFFLTNNELSMRVQHGAMRLAGLTAAVFAIASVTEKLARHRPPWPWLRSLPITSRSRVIFDASILVFVALPVVMVAGFIRLPALLSMLAVLPYLSLRASAAMRQSCDSTQNAIGQFIAEAILPTVMTTLFAPLGLLFLALAVPAAFLAASNERRHDVSRWHEMHHLADGDPLTWSNS